MFLKQVDDQTWEWVFISSQLFITETHLCCLHELKMGGGNSLLSHELDFILLSNHWGYRYFILQERSDDSP